MVDWPGVLSFHKNLSKLTVAVGIEGGIWGGQVFLQNLHLCLIVQICVCQCTTRAELSVVRVAITLSMAIRPAEHEFSGLSKLAYQEHAIATSSLAHCRKESARWGHELLNAQG